MQQLEDSIARYLIELDPADREPTLVTEARVGHIKGKIATVEAQMRQLKQIGQQMSKASEATSIGELRHRNVSHSSFSHGLGRERSLVPRLAIDPRQALRAPVVGGWASGEAAKRVDECPIEAEF